MQHSSIKLGTPCEFVNVVPVNPLISKCQIKVCYVGEEPNRNGNVITKEVATQMANSLPGSPIVGYFNEDDKDFEEHNRTIEIVDGEFVMKDTTRPYGFVDLGAKVWFQKFLDDGINEREYLMTEGYLWTGQYPEANRIIEQGNNQSMELDEKHINAHWASLDKDGSEFFIINEAIISKLCILGQEFEPCFEGASISKVQFSFDDKFQNQLFSMMNEIHESLKGGKSVEKENEMSLETPVVEEEEKATVITEEPESVTEEEETPVIEEETSTESEPVEEEEKVENEDKPAQYNLEEIQEYVELSSKYSILEAKNAELESANQALQEQVNSLNEFKLQAERSEKQKMIDSFYMLSDEDKKDVIDNINTYSLDDIESKLSVICVRNKVAFAETKEEEKVSGLSYNLNGHESESNDLPAWVLKVKSYSEKNL